VPATVRLLHHRQGWVRAAVTGFLAFLLAFGGYSSASEQGTPPPFWFLAVVIALGGATIVAIVAAVMVTAVLRRSSPATRAQAAPLAAVTRGARMPTTTRPGTGSPGRSAGPGCC
jgi:hypothetical protein